MLVFSLYSIILPAVIRERNTISGSPTLQLLEPGCKKFLRFGQLYRPG